MKRAGALLALALLLTGCGSAARKRELLAQAGRELGRSEWAQAIESLEKAREIDNRDPVVLAQLGQAYLAANLEDKAFLPLKEAAELEGGAPALLPLGRLLRRRKAYAEAEPVLQKALAFEKERGPVLVELGITYWLADKVDLARDTLEQAVAEVPGSFAAQFHLGEVYRRKDDHARARDHLNAALRIEPESPYAAFALAEVLFASGDTEQSADLYRKVIQANKPFPRVGRVYFQLAQLAHRRRENRQALGLLELAGKAGYDAEVLAVWELRLALAVRDLKRAQGALAKVQGKAKQYPQIAYLEGRLALAQGRAAEAVAALDEASRLPLDQGEVQCALGSALLARLEAAPQADEKEVEAVVAAYTKALRVRPRSPEALVGLARIHAAYRLDLQLAATQLRSALEADPSDPQARALLAPILARLGQLEPALEQLDQIEGAKDARLQFLRGAILLALNRAREAEAAIVTGLKVDSKDLDGRLVLISIYSRTGRMEQARELLARLLDPASDSELEVEAEAVYLAIASVLGPKMAPDPFRAPKDRLERRIDDTIKELAAVPQARALELLRGLTGEFCLIELRRQVPRADLERLRGRITALLARK